jgi:site-specific DNA-methyltransferase (adenine-specific)
MPRSETFNMDCLDYMRTCKDKQFSMIYTDPPYSTPDVDGFKSKYGRFGGLFLKYHGGLMRSSGHAQGGAPGVMFSKYDAGKTKMWDAKPPPEEFWEHAFRIADHLIVWGGNYFILPPSRNFIIWEKSVPKNFSMAMCEYAWVSFDGNAKIVRGRSQDKFRFHPTQKPVGISMEVLHIHGHLAKPKGILDPYMGSGSFRIAAWETGIDYVGIELDEDYYEKEEDRFKEHLSKGSLYEDKDVNTTEIVESEEGLF